MSREEMTETATPHAKLVQAMRSAYTWRWLSTAASSHGAMKPTKYWLHGIESCSLEILAKYLAYFCISTE